MIGYGNFDSSCPIAFSLGYLLFTGSHFTGSHGMRLYGVFARLMFKMLSRAALWENISMPHMHPSPVQ